MRIELGKENPAAEDKLPPKQLDGSKIGVNYADVYIKGIKGELEGGGKIFCKRRGIKLTLTVGAKTGEGLMRRFEHGPDPKNILREALREAAAKAGGTFVVEHGTMYLEME